MSESAEDGIQLRTVPRVSMPCDICGSDKSVCVGGPRLCGFCFRTLCDECWCREPCSSADSRFEGEHDDIDALACIAAGR